MEERVVDMEEILAAHPFTHELPDVEREKLVRFARLQEFAPDEFLLREGRVADTFYLIISGHVGVELYLPERGVLRLQTLGPGEVVGWSWMLPPYRATFDIRALDHTQTVALDGEGLRAQFKEDCALGYQVVQKLLGVVAQRLQATRLQLIDMYAPPGGRP